MTNAKLAVADLHKFMLGFDRMFNDTSVFAPTLDGGYPRFNILRVGKHGFRVELAVPGWNKDDLEISLHKGLLTVAGNVKQVESGNETFVYKGLSGKCFTKVFRVGDNVQVTKAYMERGLLCVDLEDITPEEELPKHIPIT